MSGRVSAIAVHPGDKQTWYVGVASGGVWKTTNAGITWTPAFQVVRREPSENGRDAGLTEAPTAQAREADTPDAARRRARGLCWAALMRRTFEFDVLACPRCGGRLRLIALIEEATVIGRILRHLGVPTETPAPRPARAPPLRAGAPDVAGWDDDPSVFDPCS